MTNRQKALALANELGATIDTLPSSRPRAGRGEHDQRDFEVTVEAPNGCHWADGVHELVITAETASEGWRQAIERMNAGVETCSAECEWWIVSDQTQRCFGSLPGQV
jgi:hypothetical protein